jgi:hypothetical protein
MSDDPNNPDYDPNENPDYGDEGGEFGPMPGEGEDGEGLGEEEDVDQQFDDAADIGYLPADHVTSKPNDLYSPSCKTCKTR